MGNQLIETIMDYLCENKDGVSINHLAHHFKLNRYMLGGYLRAYEEMGVLRKVLIGPAMVYKVKNRSLIRNVKR